MSTTQHAPDTETSAEAPTRHQPKLLELSLTQLIGGALAAATAAYLGSRLGLAGTITGAVVASLASALAAAVYTASLRHGRDRVKALPRRPRTIAISAVATLIAALAIITVVEKVSGHALSGGGPTTVQQLGGDTAGKRPDTTPAPATTATTTVSPSPTVTVTVTATPSPSDSTTPTPTPTDTATPTPSPTPSPTGTASPSS